ncbi:MAG: DPP IV N-terminal domain-containing protein, partial [Planctomycetes bacterium]|nr:DPP IV N-terminal domain-containing protein [Planctomycetota bacterium]
FACTRDGKAYLIDRKSSKVEALDPSQPTPLDLVPSQARRSGRQGGETRIVFVNQSATEVEVFWVNTDGQVRSYGKVAVGGSHSQHTFAGHLWLVRDAAGKDIAYFMGEATLGVARIDAKLQPQEAESRPPRNQGWQVRRDGNALEITSPKGAKQRAEFTLEEGSHLTGYSLVSPNQRYLIAEQRTPADPHPVTFVESSPSDQVQPKVHTFDYLKPGDKIRHDRYLLWDLSRKRQIAVDNALFPNPWSISDAMWEDDGDHFRFLYNQRGHQVMRLIRVEAKSGTAEAAINEECETFFDWSQKRFLRHLEGGSKAIWASERDGWNHLYLYDLEKGRAKQITKGEWVVRGVDRVDEEAGEIHFRAMGVYPDQDPYHVHFGVVDIKGGKVRWLTAGDGTNEITPSPDRAYNLVKYERVDLPPVHEIRDDKGKLLLELTRADWAPLKELGWRAPVRFSAKGRDSRTDIWGYLLFPSWMQAGQSLPVIESIYAGPHGHHVPKDFQAWRQERELAELGFIVAKIDGMGTNWRSKAFHDVCHKNLGDGGCPDRILWLRQAAAKHPEMDLTRVGIYGGSAGGQNALRAMLAHGDFYKAAAADCGCHDNRMDK